jgi:23S rRNA pseudouridine2605 synthase
MRLNQQLASLLASSRRKTDELIKQGLVEVDGEIATFTDTIDGNSQVRIYQKGSWVEVNKKGSRGKTTTILFYKPIFCLSTKSDPQKRKTVFDYLPPKYKHLNYAGRLDYMSEGLMILSDDGNLINRLTHPTQGKLKAYCVILKYPLKKDQIKEIEDGLEIPKDNLKYAPLTVAKTNLGAEIHEKLPGYSDSNLDFLRINKDHFAYVFYLQEGQNNQIRKICEHYGQKVLRLVRLEMGDYKISFELYKKRIIEL